MIDNPIEITDPYKLLKYGIDFLRRHSKVYEHKPLIFFWKDKAYDINNLSESDREELKDILPNNKQS